MQDSQSAGAKAQATRRGLFLGAAAAGAAATAATVLPGVAPTPAAASASRKSLPARGGGYSLSEHVKRYYRSASA